MFYKRNEVESDKFYHLKLIGLGSQSFNFGEKQICKNRIIWDFSLKGRGSIFFLDEGLPSQKWGVSQSGKNSKITPYFF